VGKEVKLKTAIVSSEVQKRSDEIDGNGFIKPFAGDNGASLSQYGQIRSGEIDAAGFITTHAGDTDDDCLSYCDKTLWNDWCGKLTEAECEKHYIIIEAQNDVLAACYWGWHDKKQKDRCQATDEDKREQGETIYGICESEEERKMACDGPLPGPAPVVPAPVVPAPVVPAPVVPAPAEPAPVVPAPAVPAPAVPVTGESNAAEPDSSGSSEPDPSEPDSSDSSEPDSQETVPQETSQGGGESENGNTANNDLFTLVENGRTCDAVFSRWSRSMSLTEVTTEEGCARVAFGLGWPFFAFSQSRDAGKNCIICKEAESGFKSSTWNLFSLQKFAIFKAVDTSHSDRFSATVIFDDSDQYMAITSRDTVNGQYNSALWTSTTNGTWTLNGNVLTLDDKPGSSSSAFEGPHWKESLTGSDSGTIFTHGSQTGLTLGQTWKDYNGKSFSTSLPSWWTSKFGGGA
jgi:hypothetical protein